MTAFSIRPETGAFCLPIEELHADVFGPGRFSRAAFRVREEGPHDPALSFLAVGGNDSAELLGSVRMTWIETSGSGCRGLLLGPLAVQQRLKGKGIGKALLNTAVDAAREAGAPYILLVGDRPYYQPFGFEPVERDRVAMPGPVDPARLLICAVDAGVEEKVCGRVRWSG
ncbi:GNAT family N-acetyltransferase [Oricola cellulosilytica]|uniref:N-acetyltransferase n=1 Tax=Oricola cellulosilytica TaxID=1429082 RepID=A0A4R0PIM7_9HYPH|nr:N-acetyltransferase [Oricola cellulosilytica]TCD15354.1 N-acetyltransferase [Oricola cellulosilytica]